MNDEIYSYLSQVRTAKSYETIDNKLANQWADYWLIIKS